MQERFSRRGGGGNGGSSVSVSAFVGVAIGGSGSSGGEGGDVSASVPKEVALYGPGDIVGIEQPQRHQHALADGTDRGAWDHCAVHG